MPLTLNKKIPVKGDWILPVIEDLKQLEITTDFDLLKNMSKSSFKTTVKQKSKLLALKYLNNLKAPHSKMDSLSYETLDIQPYLNSSLIFPELAKQLFSWRTRMVQFKNNSRNGNDDISCALGCNEDDRQEMIFKCPVILSYLPDIQNTEVNYSDIFSKNVIKMNNAGQLLQKALKVRVNCIDQQKLQTNLD